MIGGGMIEDGEEGFKWGEGGKIDGLATKSGEGDGEETGLEDKGIERDALSKVEDG